MQPIETVYADHRFRSRLEARWAVVFDSLGIRWEYETEGYDLDGVRYLHDFWLPDLQFWFEVKGVEPSEEETEKVARLAKFSGFRCFVAVGQIKVPQINDRQVIHRFDVGGRNEANYGWSECPICGLITLSRNGLCLMMSCKCTADIGAWLRKSLSESERSDLSKYGQHWRYRLMELVDELSPRIEEALMAGIQARFEHGRSGN